MATRIVLILLLSIGIPATLWMAGMSDPLLLKSGFPWVIVPCVLISIYYGISYGLFSFILLIGISLAFLHSKDLTVSQSMLEMWGGGLFLAIVSGELSSYWKKAYLTEKTSSRSVVEQLNKAEQEMKLLQLSHMQLEVSSLGAHQSLWQSLKIIEEEVRQDENAGNKLEFLAKKMMKILEAYEWLEVAAFYAVSDKGKVFKHPLAMVGNMTKPSDEDHLLVRAIKNAIPISLNKDSSLLNSNKMGTSLLAAFPIIDKNKKVQLILAVQQINYVEFKESNLNLLATLCAWLGGCLEGELQRQHRKELELEPVSQWKNTEKEVHAALKIVACHQKSTFLLGLVIDNSESKEDYILYFANNMRGGNHFWRVDREHDSVLILLLPMLDGESSGMMKSALENGFLAKFNQSFDQAGVDFNSQYFYRYQHRQELSGYLDLLRKPHYALASV